MVETYIKLIMKEYPQTTQQWADEAYAEMKIAWAEITKSNPFPNDKRKQKLIDIAATMACENRDISETKYITHAQEYVQTEFQADYETRNPIDKINFTLCFLLAYIDAHLSLSLIEEDTAKSVITMLRNNYDLTYTGELQSNVLSINFTNKS